MLGRLSKYLWVELIVIKYQLQKSFVIIFDFCGSIHHTGYVCLETVNCILHNLKFCSYQKLFRTGRSKQKYNEIFKVPSQGVLASGPFISYDNN